MDEVDPCHAVAHTVVKHGEKPGADVGGDAEIGHVERHEPNEEVGFDMPSGRLPQPGRYDRGE